MESYKERRQRAANEAPVLGGNQLRKAAADSGEVHWGWVNGRFVKMYPGGRCEDHSAFVEKPLHVLLLQQEGDSE